MFGRLQIVVRNLIRSALAPAHLETLDRLNAIAEHRTLVVDTPEVLLWAATGRYHDARSLSRFEAQVYSQNGEDGILAEIRRRLGIGLGTFVEIGIEDGQQNNTRLLLESGWTGVWIEADAAKVELARRAFQGAIDEGRLTVLSAFVDHTNIDALLTQAGITDEIDVLSVDIDHQTHNVWRAINRRARISVIEYNGDLPPSVALATPPSTDQWDGTNYFGASLKALEKIGADKGDLLVACDFNGINAFFVRADLAGDAFLPPYTAEFHYEPPRYARVGSHRRYPPSTSQRSWVGGQDATAP